MYPFFSLFTATTFLLRVLAKDLPGFQDSIMLFGDSMVEYQLAETNWQQNMSAAYVRKIDVVNRGFAGYNTNGAVALFDSLFAKGHTKKEDERIRMVLLWWGTNDARVNTFLTNPIANYTNNMRNMLESLTSPRSKYAISETPVSIVMVAPQPLVPAQIAATYGAKVGAIFNQTNQRAYKDATLQLGREWKQRRGEKKSNRSKWQIETLDAWELITGAAQGETDEVLAKYYLDGIHFSAEGHRLFWSAISSLIKDKFKGRGLDYTDLNDLPLRAPDFLKVDWTKTADIPKNFTYPSFR